MFGDENIDGCRCILARIQPSTFRRLRMVGPFRYVAYGGALEPKCNPHHCVGVEVGLGCGVKSLLIGVIDSLAHD